MRLALLVAALSIQAALPQRDGVGLVAIDESHYNYHTASGGYAAYARLLWQDGFTVAPFVERLTGDALTGVGVLIISSPFPEPRDALMRKAADAGEQLAWSSAASHSAFTTAEISSLQEWVRGGGALLLVLDHAPHGIIGGSLAAAFGVDVRNATTFDSAFRQPTELQAIPGHLLFTRRDGSIGEHAIRTGVDRVVTYTGTSLAAPPGATMLLQLPSSAMDREWHGDVNATIPRSAAGRGQAIALEYGRGRVIVLGEAGMLTTDPGSDRDTCGTRAIANSDIGNRRMALNMVRWLARQSVDAPAPAIFLNTGCRASER